MSAVRADKLGAKVTRLLATRIVDGATGPGDDPILPTELEICEEFDVSKTVAREVIARLESLKLVTVRHGRRMQLRPPSDWNYLDPLMLDLQDPKGVRRLIAELHDSRLQIEPEAAARAAAAATPEQIKRMAAMVDAMRDSVDKPDVFTEYDIAFHQEILAAAGNRVISHVMDAICDLMRTSRHLTNTVPGGLPHTVRDHASILVAIESHDADGARTAMREHILWGARRAGVLP